VKTLSAWLQLMLAEIARKRDEAEREHAEQTRRAAEQAPAAVADAVQRTQPRLETPRNVLESRGP
jgi:hypothetical protein